MDEVGHRAEHPAEAEEAQREVPPGQGAPPVVGRAASHEAPAQHDHDPVAGAERQGQGGPGRVGKVHIALRVEVGLDAGVERAEERVVLKELSGLMMGGGVLGGGPADCVGQATS